MKRIKIWLNDLTLFQQFFALCFLVLANFLIIFFMSFRQQLDNFINKQIYIYIHQAQTNFETSLFNQVKLYDYNVVHILYDASNKRIENDFLDNNGFVKKVMKGKEDIELYDGVYYSENKTIVYTIKKLNNFNLFLISMATDNFRSAYKETLIDDVIKFNILAIILILSLLLLWIATIINPLKKIKNYIIRVKNDEKTTLKIDRRDEIGQLADSLVEMHNELIKQNKIKEEMIQNISHDLKTPIATIKSYSEAIKDGIYPYDTLEKSVDVIIEHADRLENKVFNLINFNKIGYLASDNKAFQKIKMVDIINHVILGAKVLKPNIKIILELEDVYFEGEEESWRILFENLMDNALRYAKTLVKITLVDNELSVFNDGSKIEEERLEKLFRPYEKGNDGQFGLGLSIVKKVCVAYNYKINAFNENDGVTFKIYRDKEMKRLNKWHI